MLQPRSRTLRATTGVLLLTFSLAGCGTIFGGSTEIIYVNSAPNGASITTIPASGSFRTPASLTLERKNSYTLVASMEGYSSAEFLIRKNMRVGILVLDVLLTGLIGVVVDAVTGGWWNLEPDNATMVLERTDDSIDGPQTIEVTLATGEDGDVVVVDASVEGVLLTVHQN